MLLRNVTSSAQLFEFVCPSTSCIRVSPHVGLIRGQGTKRVFVQHVPQLTRLSEFPTPSAVGVTPPDPTPYGEDNQCTQRQEWHVHCHVRAEAVQTAVPDASLALSVVTCTIPATEMLCAPVGLLREGNNYALDFGEP